MVALLTATKTSKNSANTETDWRTKLAGAPEGQRHALATQIAGHYLGKGHPKAEVVQILLLYAQGVHAAVPARGGDPDRRRPGEEGR